MKYYKILNTNMCHFDFTYNIGLNIDFKPFIEDSYTCGLSFSDGESILTYCDLGTLIADVEVPSGETIIKHGNSFKAHKIVLNNIRPLFDLVTLEQLKLEGVNFHAHNDFIFRVAAMYSNTEVVKYLIDNGADIHSCNNHAFRFGTEEVLKLLEHFK